MTAHSLSSFAIAQCVVNQCWNVLVDQPELLRHFSSFVLIRFEIVFLQTDMDFQVS